MPIDVAALDCEGFTHHSPGLHLLHPRLAPGNFEAQSAVTPSSLASLAYPAESPPSARTARLLTARSPMIATAPALGISRPGTVCLPN